MFGRSGLSTHLDFSSSSRQRIYKAAMSTSMKKLTHVNAPNPILLPPSPKTKHHISTNNSNTMFSRTFPKTDDIESGSTEPLYPAMTESPELRWSFIRKIYSIVAIQLILTVIVGAFVVSYHPIVTFLTTTRGGFACYILIIITPFISMCFYISLQLVFGFAYFIKR